MDGQWEIAQGQSIRPSWGLESPSGERGGSFQPGMVLRAIHKPSGWGSSPLFFLPFFMGLMQFLAKPLFLKLVHPEGNMN